MTTALFTLPLPAATAAALPVREGLASEPEAFFAGAENAIVRSLVRLVDSEIGANTPLVLYGPTGVGKSSLALALATRRRELFGLESVIVTSGADFARSLAHAVEADSVTEHRAQHQRCDLLVIDDLHRIANKPAAQQFLVSALDALQKRGSLVIATLKQLPQSTSGLTPALVSRLMGGLVVRLALPGPVARREIVTQTAARRNLRLTAEQIDRLAGSSGSTTDQYLSATKIRQLVLELAANTDLGRPVHAAKHHKTLSRRVSMLVAKHFALPIGELRSKSRRQAVADARGLAMYLIRRLTAMSYADVGRLFGNRDHTTVLHACRKAEAQLTKDGVIQRTVDDLVMQLGAEGVL